MENSEINFVKCINCGATLVNEKCEYCNTDYSFTINLANRFSGSANPKIAGLYKILDVAFNSHDYKESFAYANKILELDPNNKEVWGIKTYSSLGMMSLNEFESNGWMSSIKQLVYTNQIYKEKILEYIFNISITAIIYYNVNNLTSHVNAAITCLETGIKDKASKAKVLFHSIENRNPNFTGQLFNKPAILNNIRNKYLSGEDKAVALKIDRKGFFLGIIAIPLNFLMIFGILGIYFNLKTLKKHKNKSIYNSKKEKDFATYGLGLSIVSLFIGIIIITNVFFGKPVKKRPEIEFVKMYHLAIRDKQDDSPDIYVYEIEIKNSKDSTRIIEALKNKLKTEPINSISYYYYESGTTPVFSANEDWEIVYETCENSGAVASTQTDDHADGFYRIADESGDLGELKKAK